MLSCQLHFYIKRGRRALRALWDIASRVSHDIGIILTGLEHIIISNKHSNTINVIQKDGFM